MGKTKDLCFLVTKKFLWIKIWWKRLYESIRGRNYSSVILSFFYCIESEFSEQAISFSLHLNKHRFTYEIVHIVLLIAICTINLPSHFLETEIINRVERNRNLIDKRTCTELRRYPSYVPCIQKFPFNVA